MAKTKPNQLPNKSKNKINNKSSEESQNRITNYLKRAEDSCTFGNFAANGNGKAEKNDFYKKCFNSKINTCEPEKNCHEIKRNLKQKLNINKQKEAHIQEAIATCSKICSIKDDEIKLLKSQNKDIQENFSATKSRKETNQMLFEDFKDEFSADQLGTLRSIEKTTKGDSNFILNCVRFIYSTDLSKLEHKSVTGASKGSPKEPISPQKLKQMKSLYDERLNDLEMQDAEKSERSKTFNRYVHRAIKNRIIIIC